MPCEELILKIDCLNCRSIIIVCDCDAVGHTTLLDLSALSGHEMQPNELKSRSSNVYRWCPVTAAVNPFCFGGCKSVISKTATLTGTQNRGTPSEPCLLVSSFMGGGVGEWGG